jgi:hypothetical protein
VSREAPALLPETTAPVGRSLPLEITCSLGIVALVVILAWLPRLFWGFWTDETATWWMAGHGWREAIARTVTWDGQSILYSVIESFFRADSPQREMILRLPSAAAMIVAGVLLYRLAERLISHGAGMIAVVAFCCAPATVEAATNARPYALALAAVLFSCSKFLDWAESGEVSSWVVYVAAGILIIYLHYLFTFVLLIQFFVLVWRWKQHLAVPWIGAAAAACVWGLSLIPLRAQLAPMLHGSKDFAGAVPPTFWQLLALCFPPQILIAAVLSGALIAARYPEALRMPAKLANDRIFLLFAWAFFGPLAFFAAARMTGASIFATRYLLFASPAVFLLLAWAASGLKLRLRILIAVAIFGATTLSIGGLWQSFRPSATDWRAPLARLAQLSQGHHDPVFMASPFNNANSRDWKAGNTPRSYLFAPLDVYPVYNPVLPLPYFLDANAERFASETIRSRLKNQGFYLIANKDSEFAQNFPGTIDSMGFQHRQEAVNDYIIFSFLPAGAALQ